jgi:hypothetical protein
MNHPRHIAGRIARPKVLITLLNGSINSSDWTKTVPIAVNAQAAI